jgi:hypothetical protein
MPRAARPCADGITGKAVHPGPGKVPQSWTGDCREDSTRHHATSADLRWAYDIVNDPIAAGRGEFGCACEIIAEHSLTAKCRKAHPKARDR